MTVYKLSKSQKWDVIESVIIESEMACVQEMTDEQILELARSSGKMTDEDNVILERSGEFMPVIDPDTGEVKYIALQKGECLLMALIKHLREKEQ